MVGRCCNRGFPSEGQTIPHDEPCCSLEGQRMKMRDSLDRGLKPKIKLKHTQFVSVSVGILSILIHLENTFI